MNTYHWPAGFKPTIADTIKAHQIGFIHHGDFRGSGVKVNCNCGWMSHRTIDLDDSRDHLTLYNSHLS